MNYLLAVLIAIDLGDPELADGVADLEAYGLIEPGRANEVIGSEVRPEEVV